MCILLLIWMFFKETSDKIKKEKKLLNIGGHGNIKLGNIRNTVVKQTNIIEVNMYKNLTSFFKHQSWHLCMVMIISNLLNIDN